jgi:hypothetical protein
MKLASDGKCAGKAGASSSHPASIAALAGCDATQGIAAEIPQYRQKRYEEL